MACSQTHFPVKNSRQVWAEGHKHLCCSVPGSKPQLPESTQTSGQRCPGDMGSRKSPSSKGVQGFLLLSFRSGVPKATGPWPLSGGLSSYLLEPAVEISSVLTVLASDMQFHVDSFTADRTWEI